MKAQVLIIDDDLDLREILAFVLGDNGYEMHACPNGREAFKWLVEHKPDVIMVDLMMPVMNGRDFLKHKNEIPELKAIPTIIMSASINLKKEFPEHAVLTKPFNLELLIQCIGKLLQENQPSP